VTIANGTTEVAAAIGPAPVPFEAAASPLFSWNTAGLIAGLELSTFSLAYVFWHHDRGHLAQLEGEAADRSPVPRRPDFVERARRAAGSAERLI
jgi:hypothetical protein